MCLYIFWYMEKKNDEQRFYRWKHISGKFLIYLHFLLLFVSKIKQITLHHHTNLHYKSKNKRCLIILIRNKHTRVFFFSITSITPGIVHIICIIMIFVLSLTLVLFSYSCEISMLYTTMKCVCVRQRRHFIILIGFRLKINMCFA